MAEKNRNKITEQNVNEAEKKQKNVSVEETEVENLQNENHTDEKKDTDKKEKAEKKEDKNKKKKSEKKIKELEIKLDELSDRYIRLQAEFNNFRRRTVKEKAEIIKSGGETVLKDILPVIDDFERAIDSMKEISDDDAGKQGTLLIYSKFLDFLNQHNVKEIDALHQDFDVDIHEALTKIPAPEKELKGKVVDVVQKGYILNEKVIRFAKVVVGE